ncbi:MAG TPA: prolyl oligopeptidase family serine peptidase [Terriglobales bacterium]|nr:prolyl oligopeptidase family serine peptidase [Terriglobales bacterium]
MRIQLCAKSLQSSKLLSLIRAVAAAVTLASVAAPCGRTQDQQSRGAPITVRDAIVMTRLGLPDSLLNTPIKEDIAQFSPNGRRFVIVLKKGNLQKNTNDYSLLLYRTLDAFRSPKPDVLLVLSSSSNRPAIQSVKWLDDNDTIAFLGERKKLLPQVYELNARTKRLKRMTAHQSPVVRYDSSADGRTLLFEADPTTAELQKAQGASGNPVLTRDIINVLFAHLGEFRPTTTQGEELYLVRNRRQETHLHVPGVVYTEFLRPSVSPSGQYAVIGVFPREIPAAWSGYRVPWLQAAIRAPREKGETALTVAEFMIVNTNTGELRPLLDAPLSWRNMGLAWAPDGKSIAVSGSFLPLTGTMDSAERAARQSRSFVVEVNPASHTFVKITDEDLTVKRWDRSSGKLVLTREDGPNKKKEIALEKIGNSWRQVASSPPERSEEARPQIILQQGINTPPKIYASRPTTAKKALLLDLNPQFSELRFGKVEAVSWEATDGHEVSGGLFFPPGYQPGQRYPLVIQTHGFFSGKFYMDGPWSSAFAARPLAAQGFIVLQVGYSTKQDEEKFENTTAEGPRQMAAYEGAIDYLDKRGLIDRDRVGIIGFSRTVYTVAYTLTHSHYRFTAATLADGITGSYCDYLLFPYLSNTPLLNGGLPFSPTLSSWLKNAPNFQLDRVRTPVRIEAYGPASVLGLWEWFSGLTLLKRPVELIYLPRASHLLTRPADRLISQQGNVDWFCFWLKHGEHGTSPQELNEFSRWKRLRTLEEKKH